MQLHIADLGVGLPKLDPDVREQASGGHEGPPWVGDSGARLHLPAWISNDCPHTPATQSAKAVGCAYLLRT
jgi:hypothetical protein